MALRHQIIERLYDSVLKGNEQAARVLGKLCENGMDIVASIETALSQLFRMNFHDNYPNCLPGSVAMRKENKALPIMQEILLALFAAAELGVPEAAFALADIKKRKRTLLTLLRCLGVRQGPKVILRQYLGLGKWPLSTMEV